MAAYKVYGYGKLCPYYCVYCGEEFKDAEGLINHKEFMRKDKNHG